MNWEELYMRKSDINDIDSSSIDEIIKYATKVKATDIHVIVGSKPVVRVKKSLEDIPGSEEVTPEVSEKMVNSLLDEKNKEILKKVGQVDFAFSKDGFGRFRANVFKQKGNYSIALRAIPLSIPNFDDLKLPQVVKSFSKNHSGLVLVTGATGSGKSTTLASLLKLINETRKCHIITIEDPIEYVHNHISSKVNQREVGEDTDSFAGALRAALREDPDVILVGEMRDPETVSIALTAAETGHLVFSTLHTVGASKTVDRIIDVFPAEKQNQIRSQLATVLNGVISQQLIPKADGSGIIAACEIMIATPAIRNLIREGKQHQINSIIQTSAELGMQSLDSVLAQYFLNGTITKEEALARVKDEQGFLSLVEKRW